MTRNDVLILDALEEMDCINQLKAMPIRKIIDEVNLSPTTVRSIVKGLTVGKLVSKGLGSGNATTYYITSEGLQYLKEVKAIC